MHPKRRSLAGAEVEAGATIGKDAVIGERARVEQDSTGKAGAILRARSRVLHSS